MPGGAPGAGGRPSRGAFPPRSHFGGAGLAGSRRALASRGRTLSSSRPLFLAASWAALPPSLGTLPSPVLPPQLCASYLNTCPPGLPVHSRLRRREPFSLLGLVVSEARRGSHAVPWVTTGHSNSWQVFGARTTSASPEGSSLCLLPPLRTVAWFPPPQLAGCRAYGRHSVNVC